MRYKSVGAIRWRRSGRTGIRIFSHMPLHWLDWRQCPDVSIFEDRRLVAFISQSATRPMRVVMDPGPHRFQIEITGERSEVLQRSEHQIVVPARGWVDMYFLPSRGRVLTLKSLPARLRKEVRSLD